MLKFKTLQSLPLNINATRISPRRLLSNNIAPIPKQRNRLRISLGVSAVTVLLGGIALLNYHPSLKRSTKFWYEMFPIFLDYKYTQFIVKSKKEVEQDAEYQILHKKYSPKVLELILELRGIYVKMGQIGAMRPDIMPDIYREKFRVLLDSVPSLSGAHVREIVEKALSEHVEDVFSEFDFEAIGAASIGQVHKARLRKNGKEVVVKIKYPDSFELFNTDIGTLKNFIKLAQPELSPVMDEMKIQFLKEFDFKREAACLYTIRNNIMPNFNNVIIPEPILEYCNDDIIVMEYIPGVKLLDGILKNYELKANRIGYTFEELKLKKGIFTLKESIQISSRLICANIKDFIQFVVVFIFNNTFTFFGLKPLNYPTKFIDQKSLYDTLLNVQGYQMFINRIFQGDPHLGNILLTPDGKLGLIDYGQVKLWNKKTAREYGETLALLREDDKDKIVEMGLRSGFTTERNDPFVIYKSMVVTMDRENQRICDGMNMQQYMEYLSKLDPTKTLPQDNIFAVRASILLRGIAELMGIKDVSLAHYWKSYGDYAVKHYPAGADDDLEYPSLAVH